MQTKVLNKIRKTINDIRDLPQYEVYGIEVNELIPLVIDVVNKDEELISKEDLEKFIYGYYKDELE